MERQDVKVGADSQPTFGFAGFRGAGCGMATAGDRQRPQRQEVMSQQDRHAPE